MKIFSKNTWGVDVNNAWPLTCKASCLKKIELRPLISGFDFDCWRYGICAWLPDWLAKFLVQILKSVS